MSKAFDKLWDEIYSSEMFFNLCLETYVKEFKPTREELLDLMARNTDDWQKVKEISKYLKEEENE